MLAQQSQLPDPDVFADILRSKFAPDDIKIITARRNLSIYQNDPVGFCERVLGEHLTDDIKAMMESVRDNQITIAVSANGTGKSHGAARVAVWFYLVHQDVKVFTAAAPPLDNLKNILWGEIGSVITKHPDFFASHTITSLDVRRGPEDFLTGVTIPSSGTEQEKEAKFCTDADELFELTNGELVTYGSLINKVVDVISITPDFKQELSKAEFFDNGVQPVYEITLSSGLTVVRTGEHPFYSGEIKQSFKKHGGRHIKGRYLVKEKGWINVENIKEGDVVLTPENTAFNFGDSMMGTNEIKVIAYLIGDGCISDKSSILFMQEDNRQLAEFKESVHALGAIVKKNYFKEEYGWRVNGDGTGKTGSNPIKNLLIKHGLLGSKSSTKHIPASIFLLNKESIALFLNRLFSTDGWACVCKTGKYSKAEIGYVSKSKRLVSEIQRLLFRFGISSMIKKQKKSWTYKGIKKYNFYWLCIINRADEILRFANQIGIYGKEDAVEKCVEFSANITQPKATWRKSWWDGFLWDRIKSIKMIGKRPTVGVHVPKNNTYLTNIVEHNSGKHQKYMLFVLDEGDAIPNAVLRGIESCMSGGIIVRLLIMLNPRQATGPTYRMQQDGSAKIIHLSAFNHPNVITGDNIIPGAVDRETTVRRINMWTRPLKQDEKAEKETVFTLPTFLEGVVGKRQNGTMFPALEPGKYKIINSAFSYMVLGQYPAQAANQLISQEWISAARSRYDVYVAKYGEVPPVGVKGIMGLDCAEKGEDKNVAVGRYGGYVTPFTEWGGVDTIETGSKAVDWYNAHTGITHAYVDATGVGTGVAPHMERLECIATSVKVACSPTFKTELGEFSLLRDQLWWQVREWLRTDSGAMLPPDEEFLEELICPTYETDTGKIIVTKQRDIREILGRSPNKADAFRMTFAGEIIGFFSGYDLS